MTRLALFTGLALCLPAASQAQLMVGKAIAVDGDSIVFGNAMIRLSAIDTLELSQTCARGHDVSNCGEAAKAHLQTIIDRGGLSCQQVDTDQYKRQVSVCKAGRSDLGAAMISAGYAVALSHAPDSYRILEAQAKADRIGMWGWEFETPTEYKAANNGFVELRPPSPPQEPSYYRSRPGPEGSVYYRSCAEAWRAGVAPIRRGEPGYRSGLDGDNDGIACEPLRRGRW